MKLIYIKNIFAKYKIITNLVILIIIYALLYYIWFLSHIIIQPIESFIENWKLIEKYDNNYYLYYDYYIKIFSIIIILNTILILFIKKYHIILSFLFVFLAILITWLFVFIV